MLYEHGKEGHSDATLILPHSNLTNDTKQEGTDLFSSLNFKLRKENFIEGDYFNIKITTKKDIEVLAKLIDCLQQDGIISESKGSKPREVLIRSNESEK